MATFAALDETLDEVIHLPIKGKTYRIQSPSARTGLMVTRLMGIGMDANSGKLTADAVANDPRTKAVLDDAEERELMVSLLGPTLDEMIADGLPWSMIQHVNQTVMIWCVYGMDSAAAFWGRHLPTQPRDHLPKGSGKRPTRKARQG